MQPLSPDSQILTPSTPTSVVSFENVSLFLKAAGRELQVVRDITFTIRQGEFFALVGESGSGKTVIGRSIMKLYPRGILRIAGRIMLGDTDVATADTATLRKLRGGRVSMIFQEPMTSLNPLMTVETQIDEAIRAHNPFDSGVRKARVLELLANVQFSNPEQVARMYPHELSGGMRQRVVIAMALANNPSLIIADEPTTALDVTIQQEIMEILIGLRDRLGLSVLFISHDLSLVYRYADRLCVLYGGLMMELGAACDVIKSPSHPYTRDLLECVPRERVGETRQPGIEGSVPWIDNWFEGCRYAPRCRDRRENCTSGDIPIIQIDEARSARCQYPLR